MEDFEYFNVEAKSLCSMFICWSGWKLTWFFKTFSVCMSTVRTKMSLFQSHWLLKYGFIYLHKVLILLPLNICIILLSPWNPLIKNFMSFGEFDTTCQILRSNRHFYQRGVTTLSLKTFIGGAILPKLL